MRKLYAMLLILSLSVLVACGNQSPAEQSSGKNETHTEDAELKPVEVNILSSGEDFTPGEEGIIEVKVTQGEENVADANEVLIEIWKNDHKDESINYEAENKGDGLYTLAHTFPEDDIYYVIAHVTARDMHVMPRKEFVVGNVSTNEQTSFQHHHHDHSHDHHSHGLSIHLMEPVILKKGEQALWMVHLAEEDGSPLSEATVRFDYWQDGQEHVLIDAAETVAGEYTAEFSFPEAGEYRLLVHVEKDELHEHQETKVQVE